MDPEDLSVVVALSEGKAVALWCAIVASHAKQNLIDRVVGNLCTGVGVQQPEYNFKSVASQYIKTQVFLI